jgi:tripartite-type tricarboxylate transporter receptor subunit TctC
MGASGRTSPTATHLKELNGIIGTKFKPILGYKGSTGANLAMERGEVDGATKSWASLKTANADWVRDRKVNILVQYAMERDPDLPDVPLLTELAKDEANAKLLRFLAVGNAMGRNLVAPSGVPADRIAALRGAFLAMMKDPPLLNEAAKLKISIGAMSGERMQALVEETLATPASVLVRANALRK